MLKLKFPFLLLLLKQTWVCSPECNKANLLTPCYGKGKYTICICIVKAPIQGGWVAYAQQPLTPSGLSERSCIGRIWGKGCRVCDSHWLVAMLQESCAQPEVTILHLGGGLNSCRRYINIYVSLEAGLGLLYRCPSLS